MGKTKRLPTFFSYKLTQIIVKMFAIANTTTNISNALKVCFDTLIYLTVTKPDWIIHSINNGFKFTIPTYEMDLNYEFESLSKDMPDMYILDLDEIDLDTFFDTFYKLRSFNPRAKYLLTGSEIPPEASETLGAHFAWNVVFVNRYSGELYTYFPYKSRKMQQLDTEWVLIGNCSFLNDSNSTVLFPDKLPSVWDNSTISLSLCIAPPYWICNDCEKEGYDSDLYQMSFDHFNVTKNVTVREYFDEKWEDETLRNLQEGCFDIILGETTYLDVDNTYPHMEYFYIIAVFNPEEMPRWKYIFTLFSKKVWLAWMMTCLSFYLVGILNDVVFRKFNKTVLYHKAAIIFRLSIGQAHRLAPRDSTEGLLLMSILIFTTIMAFIYTGRFPYFLVGINYEKSIQSLQDIVDRKLTIGTVRDDVTKDFFSITAEMADHYERHHSACDFTESCMNQMITGRNMSFFITTPQLNYWEQYYLDERGRCLYHHLSEAPTVKQQFGSAMRKGHPITNRLSTFLQYLDQHGIRNRIISEYEKKGAKQIENLETASLTIEYITAPLFIWMAGVFSSFIIFSFEKHY